MCRNVFIALVLATLAGCTSSTPVAIKRDNGVLLADREVVVRCTIVKARSRANLNFFENCLEPFPLCAAAGNITDVSLHVDSVLKGNFYDTSIQIFDAQTPDQRHASVMDIDDVWSQKQLVIGFDRALFGARSGFEVAQPSPADK